MAVSAIIQQKFIDLFEEDKSKKVLQTVEDEKALGLIFAYYEDQMEYLSEQINGVINMSAQLKVKEIEMNESYKALKATHRTFQGSSEPNTKEEHYNSSMIQQLNQFHQKILCLQRENEELKMMLNQEQNAKLKAKEDHEKSLKLYKNQFLSEFENLLQNERKEQASRSMQIIKSLQKQRQDQKIKVKYIIDEVNYILEITTIGSENIEEWMRTFKQKSEKYRREVDSAFEKDTKMQDKSPICKFAELQKRKILSRRMYVLKTVMNK